MAEPIRLLDLPHHQARELLRATDAPVFLSVNPVEFHGPHLSLHNDRLITAGLSRDLHLALARLRGRAGEELPFLVADDLELGVDPTCGPGTRHVHFTDVRRVVVETCRALVELGARRAILNTFHGAPLHNLALEAGRKVFEHAGGRAVAPLTIALRVMIGLEPEDLDGAVDETENASDEEKALLRSGFRFDFHAGWLETSLAMHYAPESVSPVHRSLPPAPLTGRKQAIGALSEIAARLGKTELAAELAFLATAATWPELRPFPGYTGFPHLASARVGEWIATRFIERYAATAHAVLWEGAEAPRPPFAWIRALTLDGRVPLSLVPLEAIAADPPARAEAEDLPRRAVGR